MFSCYDSEHGLQVWQKRITMSDSTESHHSMHSFDKKLWGSKTVK